MSKSVNSMEARFLKVLSSIPLHLVLILACVIWMVPWVGLFISSFRPKNLIAINGWWEALKSLVSFTLDNYIHVIPRGNMGRSFINRLLIAIPSTLIPI